MAWTRKRGRRWTVIDVYIPETHVIIEQKSLGKPLDQKIHNSDDVDLTPYEQAKYGADVMLTALVPMEEYNRLIAEITEATSAKAVLEEVERTYFFD